jgi:hypothetical protein
MVGMRKYNLSNYDVFRDLNSIIILKIGEGVRSSFYLEIRCWTLAFHGLPELPCSNFIEDLV